ncbi:MAG: hypothetical protein PHC51_07200 [bacterium]|nr:hypothetical protein [bacterium]
MNLSHIEKSFFLASTVLCGLLYLLVFLAGGGYILLQTAQAQSRGVLAVALFGAINIRFWVLYADGILGRSGKGGNIFWLIAFKSSAILLVVLILKGQGDVALISFMAAFTLYLLLGICIYCLLYFRKGDLS